jgi:hypothetical protein
VVGVRGGWVAKEGQDDGRIRLNDRFDMVMAPYHHMNLNIPAVRHVEPPWV